MYAFSRAHISGLILAGGQGRRLGGADKGLLRVAGRPLITYSIAALEKQVDTLFISANRNLDTYRALGFPVLSDDPPANAGPLAGIARAMRAARSPCLLTVPCDSPRLPVDLAQRLCETLSQHRAQISCVHDGERRQPLFALLSRTLLQDLEAYLAHGGRRVQDWYQRHHCVECDFSVQRNCFVNINTVADKEMLEENKRFLKIS